MTPVAYNQTFGVTQSMAGTSRVELTVLYEDANGRLRTDISAQFMNCLLDLCYRERLNNGVQEYTLNVSLADATGFFRNNFAFDVWASLLITIHQPVSWGMGQTINKQLPRFFISAIEMHCDKSSGTTMHLTCSSVPPQSEFRTQKSSAAYPASESNESADQAPSEQNSSAADNSGDDIGSENIPEIAGTIKQPMTASKAKLVKAGVTDLKSISQDICKRNGWQLQYLTSINPQIARLDRHSQSSSVVLNRLCRDNNLYYGCTNGTLLVASMADVVKRQPVATLVCPGHGNPGGLNGQGLTSWTFSRNTEDIYSECECSYTDSTTGNTITATATDANQLEGAPSLIDTALPNEVGEGDVAEFDRESME
jgi:hypothetical protein